jgi:signal transduction histidine kinase
LTSPLRILHLEDDPLDAEYIKSTLEEEDIACDIVRVETRDDFIATIARQEFDILLADYMLPGFDGLSALAIAKEKCPETPFILISGNMGEELAIESLKSGATDYVLKNRITRLVPAVRRALREATERSERRQAVRELRESHAKLRQLAAHLLSVREEERMNIARDIHDELGQVLAALKMDIAWLSDKYSDHATIVAKSASMRATVANTILSMKRICMELRPALLDHFGLGATMEWQAEEFKKRSGIECKVVLEPHDIAVDKDQAIVLFRIFQESLTNVIKHAKATKVEASLRHEDKRIVLVVHDNGVGISQEQTSKPNSFGLLGMRERLYVLSGTISIKGKRQKGTTLTVTIPVPDAAAGK